MGPTLLAILALTSQVLTAENVDCPGVIQGNNEGSNPTGYCCVGGHLTNSVCEGWPICKGPTTVTQTSVQCSTKVPFSLDDYDSVVESASSKYLTDGWDVTGTAEGGSEQTESSSGAMSTSKGGGDDDAGTVPSKTADAGGAEETDSGASVVHAAGLMSMVMFVLAVAAL